MTQAEECLDAINDYAGWELWEDVIARAEGFDPAKSCRPTCTVHFFDGSRLHEDHSHGWIVLQPGDPDVPVQKQGEDTIEECYRDERVESKSVLIRSDIINTLRSVMCLLDPNAMSSFDADLIENALIFVIKKAGNMMAEEAAAADLIVERVLQDRK